VPQHQLQDWLELQVHQQQRAFLHILQQGELLVEELQRVTFHLLVQQGVLN
jgi:hypothetical protein